MVISYHLLVSSLLGFDYSQLRDHLDLDFQWILISNYSSSLDIKRSSKVSEVTDAGCIYHIYNNAVCDSPDTKIKGDSGELNPGPLAPKARIIPLDHYPMGRCKSKRVYNL